MLDQTSYEALVLSWLRSKDGDVVLVTSLSKKFMVGDASMLTLLNELVACGKVRRSTAKRTLGFYIPTDAQLNAERRANEEVRQTQPLKVDRQRRELYAQLEAARASIRSIG